MKITNSKIIVSGLILIAIAIVATILYNPPVVVADIEIDVGVGEGYDYCYSVGCFNQVGITQFREALNAKIDTEIVGKSTVELFKEIDPAVYEEKRLASMGNVKNGKAKLREARFWRNTVGLEFEEIGCETLVFENPDLSNPDLLIIKMLESNPEPQYFTVRNEKGEVVDSFIGCK